MHFFGDPFVQLCEVEVRLHGICRFYHLNHRRLGIFALKWTPLPRILFELALGPYPNHILLRLVHELKQLVLAAERVPLFGHVPCHLPQPLCPRISSFLTILNELKLQPRNLIFIRPGHDDSDIGPFVSMCIAVVVQGLKLAKRDVPGSGGVWFVEEPDSGGVGLDNWEGAWLRGYSVVGGERVKVVTCLGLDDLWKAQVWLEGRVFWWLLFREAIGKKRGV